MRFDHVRKGSSVPNLTPLIDVVFLLLIFFMLTAHFVQDETITIDLPEAESSEQLNNEKIVSVTIDKDARLYINDKPVEMADLEPRLKTAIETRSNKSVQIRGDVDSGLGVAVSVLDAARKAGATDVDIITKRP